MNFGYHKLYIDGKLVDAENQERELVICPATGEVIAEVAKAGKADAEKALIAADKGFKFWSKLSLAKRTEWMLKLRTAVLENEDLFLNLFYENSGRKEVIPPPGIFRFHSLNPV